MVIDELPDAPDPASDRPDIFSQKAAAMVLAQKKMVPQMNALGAQVVGLAAEVQIESDGAASSASVAAAAAEAALYTAGTAVWGSGTAYAKGATVWSPMDARTYRRQVAGAGTIDPSLDTGNWRLLSQGESPTLYVRDEKINGTNGGGVGSAGWTTRALNTVKFNSIPGASLSSNQVILPAGTYEFTGSAPAAGTAMTHQARLYNQTDSVVVDVGTSEYVNGSSNKSLLKSVFTITAQKGFTVQHYIPTTGVGSSLGQAASAGNAEVYAEIYFRKLA